METLQKRYQNLDSVFQSLNGSVQNLTRNQDQIGRLANDANFAVQQLGGQLRTERDTKVRVMAKISYLPWP